MNAQAVLNGPSHQRGMGMWGGLMVALIIIILAMGAMRIGPHYMDFEMVKGVMDRLPAAEVHSMKRDQIRERFAKQFRVEGFKVPLKEMLDIERTREQTLLNINYEVREHLFSNVYVVLVFSEQREFK